MTIYAGRRTGMWIIMDYYILRKEKCGFILYDIAQDAVFISNIDVEDCYCEANYKSLSRDPKCVLPDNYFAAKRGRLIDNTQFNNTLSAPETVFLEITKKCNLRCQHCFNESGVQEKVELSTQEIKHLIDRFAQIGVFKVKITGGEPFFRQDIFELLSYLDYKSLNYIIFTNGTSISYADIQKLKDHRNLLKIRISIDGNRETNDAIRGKGTFDRAMTTAKLLAKNHIPCEINFTITTTNYKQISELSDYLVENDIPCKINIGMVKIAGRAKKGTVIYYFTEDNLPESIAYIKKQLQDAKCVKPYYLLEPLYYKLFGHSFGCPAARLTTTVKSTGDVYPCGLLSSCNSFICGNILESDFQTIWNNSDVMKLFRQLPENDKCKNCSIYLNKCTGACRGNALNYYNDICGEDINCMIYREDLINREVLHG